MIMKKSWADDEVNEIIEGKIYTKLFNIHTHT